MRSIFTFGLIFPTIKVSHCCGPYSIALCMYPRTNKVAASLKTKAELLISSTLIMFVSFFMDCRCLLSKVHNEVKEKYSSISSNNVFDYPWTASWQNVSGHHSLSVKIFHLKALCPFLSQQPSAQSDLFRGQVQVRTRLIQ